MDVSRKDGVFCMGLLSQRSGKPSLLGSLFNNHKKRGKGKRKGKKKLGGKESVIALKNNS